MTKTQRIVSIRHAERIRRRPTGRRPLGRIWPALAALSTTLAMVTAILLIVVTSTLDILTAGLPDPAMLRSLAFAQPTIIYDRDGRVELGRFQAERRRVVTFDEVPRLVLDATTTAEDRTFWDNAGIDVAAIVSAIGEAAAGEGERGASTITQQLVRARLLPEEVVGEGADRYMRKAKEIVQSLRLSDEFPGEAGKQRVITAYLNEIFYGHSAYGIAAAAETYFGTSDLSELSISQAALLAGLPQSPTDLDPYRYAVADDEGRLVVPDGAPAMVRRDWILRGLTTAGRWTTLSPKALETALAEPIVLAPERRDRVPGGQFTWQVRRQLRSIVGPDVDLERAGYRVITTLDWDAQRLAVKWLGAAAIAPNLSARKSKAMLDRAKIPASDRKWINDLRGKDLHNASLVALDYRSGDLLAYVGSAGYDRNDLARPEFEPKYDAAGDGTRQPGSAFKPLIYATAFDRRVLSPGSLLLDITTEFDPRQDWAPRDADSLDRGPVLVRRALQYSLNIPAIRTLQRVGSERVADVAEAMGIRFAGGRERFVDAGLAGALGTVEVRPLDLTSAYGTIGNGGVHVPPRMILEIQAPDGSVAWKAPSDQGTRAISRQAAYLVTDILAGNTDRSQNPIWAEKLELRNGPNGSRRPAAVKTGTTNDARDLATYGFLPPAGKGGIGLAVGIWMGNSDHSYPKAAKPATSLTAAAPLWRAFVRDLTKGDRVAKFARPSGVVDARIDAWSGGKPGPWTRDTTDEWFIAGTAPGGRREIDPAGLLYTQSCGGWRVDPLGAELGPRSWDDDVADWAQRARHGPGVSGRLDSRTAYFWGENSWGGRIIGACAPARSQPGRDKDKGKDKDKPKDRGNGGGGNGNGGNEPAPAPTEPPAEGG